MASRLDADGVSRCIRGCTGVNSYLQNPDLGKREPIYRGYILCSLLFVAESAFPIGFSTIVSSGCSPAVVASLDFSWEDSSCHSVVSYGTPAQNTS